MAATTMPAIPANAICAALSAAPAFGGGAVALLLGAPVVGELPASVEVGVDRKVEYEVVPTPVPVGKYDEVEFALNEVKTLEVETLSMVTYFVMVRVEERVVVESAATATKGRSATATIDDSCMVIRVGDVEFDLTSVFV